MTFDFDCFVIGAGSGGVRAAKLAASKGKKVGIAEEFRYGGTCVIRGCVPKKLMLFASDFGQKFKDSSGFGWDINSYKIDWTKFQDRKNKEISRLERIYSDGLKSAGVCAFNDRAKLLGGSKILLNSFLSSVDLFPALIEPRRTFILGMSSSRDVTTTPLPVKDCVGVDGGSGVDGGPLGATPGDGISANVPRIVLMACIFTALLKEPLLSVNFKI